MSAVELKANSTKFLFDDSMVDAGVLTRIHGALMNPDMSRLEKYEADDDYVLGTVHDFVLPLSDGYSLCTTGRGSYDDDGVLSSFGGVYIGRNNDGNEVADKDVLLSWMDDDLIVMTHADEDMVRKLCERMNYGVNEASVFLQKQQDGIQVDDGLPSRKKTFLSERGDCVFDDTQQQAEGQSAEM